MSNIRLPAVSDGALVRQLLAAWPRVEDAYAEGVGNLYITEPIHVFKPKVAERVPADDFKVGAWSAADRRDLAAWWHGGVKRPEIARRLNRSVNDVYSAIVRFGLRKGKVC